MLESKLSSGGGVSSRSCFTLLVIAGTSGGGGGGGTDGCGLFRISVLPFTWISAGTSSGVVAAAGSGVESVASSSSTHVM